MWRAKHERPPSVNGVAWRNVSAAEPCPKCGKSDWCRASADGDWCCCRRVADARHERKAGRRGRHVSLHRLTPWPEWPPPVYSLADGAGRRAGADVLNRVYAALLPRLPLSATHADALRRRGLGAAAIRAAGYATLGNGRGRAVRELIERRPGKIPADDARLFRPGEGRPPLVDPRRGGRHAHTHPRRGRPHRRPGGEAGRQRAGAALHLFVVQEARRGGAGRARPRAAVRRGQGDRPRHRRRA